MQNDLILHSINITFKYSGTISLGSWTEFCWLPVAWIQLQMSPGERGEGLERGGKAWKRVVMSSHLNSFIVLWAFQVCPGTLGLMHSYLELWPLCTDQLRFFFPFQPTSCSSSWNTASFFHTESDTNSIFKVGFQVRFVVLSSLLSPKSYHGSG